MGIRRLAVDEWAHAGLKRGRIKNLMAPVSVVYGWASEGPRRRRTGVHSNPVAGLRWPPKDETPRLRVCLPEEAKLLLGAITPADAKHWPRHLPYAIAFYGGLRRSGMWRLDWEQVDWDNLALLVLKEKSAAGRRGVPMVAALADILRQEWVRQNAPTSGKVLGRFNTGTFNAGYLQDKVDEVWSKAGLARLTLHECRHTYASWLVASKAYSLREMMTFTATAAAPRSTATSSSFRSRGTAASRTA